MAYDFTHSTFFSNFAAFFKIRLFNFIVLEIEKI